MLRSVPLSKVTDREPYFTGTLQSSGTATNEGPVILKMSFLRIILFTFKTVCRLYTSNVVVDVKA